MDRIEIKLLKIKMLLPKNDLRFHTNNIQILIFLVAFAVIFYSARFLLKSISKTYINLESKIQNLIASRYIKQI